MDNYFNNICGGEFDWFGRGLDGSIAMFSTAGEGYVPKSVVSYYEQHVSVFQDLDNPNWGSSNVWKIYSELGLFVFDWDLPGGPYIKCASPVALIDPKLEAQITTIDGLPKIETNFLEIVDIDFSGKTAEYIGGQLDSSQ